MGNSSARVKREAAQLLAECGDIGQQLAAFEREREAQIAPHRQRYEKRIAPINATFDAQTAELRQQQAQAQARLEKLLLSALGDDDAPLIPQLTGELATARVETTTRREVDALAFYNAVPQSERTPAFWGCLTVAIGQADKFWGKLKVDALATLKRTHRVVVSLK